LASAYKNVKNEAIAAVNAASQLQNKENKKTGDAATGSTPVVKNDNTAANKELNKQNQAYKDSVNKQKQDEQANQKLKQQQEEKA